MSGQREPFVRVELGDPRARREAFRPDVEVDALCDRCDSEKVVRYGGAWLCRECAAVWGLA